MDVGDDGFGGESGSELTLHPTELPTRRANGLTRQNSGHGCTSGLQRLHYQEIAETCTHRIQRCLEWLHQGPTDFIELSYGILQL